MTHALPPTHLASSRLVRTLAGLAPAQAAGPRPAMAERLGQWLGFTDAMSVYGALHPGGAKAAGGHAASFPGVALAQEVARLRAALAAALTAGSRPEARRQAGRTLPRPEPGMPGDVAADYSPYHRYYLTHQRDMAANVGRLRGKARAALAEGSPRLRPLAELDGALDAALAERERDLFAKVPALLEKRFNELRDRHRQALADATQPDDPETWMQPGAWLAVFCQELHQVLLAELEVRLEPVLGLLAAARHEENP